MNKRTPRKLGMVLAAITVSACLPGQPSSSESIGVSSAALSTAASMATPNGWDGTVVDLMFADAFASCSWVTSDVPADPAGMDGYLAAVLAKMVSVLPCGGCGNSGNIATDWVCLRAQSACNAAPSAEALSVTLLQKQFAPQTVPQTYGGVSLASDVQSAVNAILRTPTVNLCVAQQLRSAFPGAAGSQSLLLAAEDQRELLELTRERAQIAMLGFAQLARIALDSSRSSIPQNSDPNVPLPVVMQWLRIRDFRPRDDGQ